MSTLQKVQPTILAPITKEQKEEAHTVHAKILALMNEASAKEAELQTSYVQLGTLLFRVQAKQLWLVLGYSNWTEYFTVLQEKFDRSKGQLYAYIGVAKTLKPYVADKDLFDMGIGKASELRKTVELTGKAPSPEIIKKAINPATKIGQFRQDLYDENNVIDHNEKGSWVDFGGCYLSPGEKEEWIKSIEIAKSIDPVVSNSLPEHVQRKEAMLRLAREFIGTWGMGDQ